MDPTYERLIFFFLVICVCVWIHSSRPNENKQIKVVLNKIMMYVEGIYFMVACSDSKGIGPKKNPDPDSIKDAPSTMKRIIFIRHGESGWNEVFNKGFGPIFVVSVVTAMWRELLMMVSMDSALLDSPLISEGTMQARGLLAQR